VERSIFLVAHQYVELNFYVKISILFNKIKNIKEEDLFLMINEQVITREIVDSKENVEIIL